MNVRLSQEEKIKVANSQDIFEIMRKILLREHRLGRKSEHFWVIGLATNHRLEFVELVSLGSINAASVTPFEVFSLAVAKKSPSVIIAHNHPSGELQPSKEDKSLTQELIKGGAILRVHVMDHLIISEEGYFSFRDAGLIAE